MRKSYYGWTRDIPDKRDHLLTLAQPIPLPPSVDMRASMPPVYSQGQLGSCTANAIATALEFERWRQKLPALSPSRLFIYYNEREMEGTIQSDSGAQIRDGMKSIANQGAPDESAWPYDIPKFATRPPQAAYDAGTLDLALDYSKVPQDATQLRSVVASGWPIAFGFSVYSSFESTEVSQTGVVPMPSNGEQLLGGHAVLAVGYDDVKRCFLVRNSWGAGWGIGGYFWLPYDYVTDGQLASDFWCVKVVGERQK